MESGIEAIEALFDRGGRLASSVPRYEYRPQQVAMARAVARAFGTASHLLVEAGTGVGKSLAYLIPALLWASAHGERVVVSTSTINLQEQLFNKDIPAVCEALGLHLSAAILRGRSNYVCLRRLARLLGDAEAGALPDALVVQAVDLVRWASASRTGCRSDLDREPVTELWERVCSEPDACHRRFCPYSERCFYCRAQNEAEAARLVVVNHHLLLADALIRAQGAPEDEASVLPAFGRCIVDEGHELPDAARDVLGVACSRAGVARLVAVRTPAMLSAPAVIPALERVRAAADTFFEGARELVVALGVGARCTGEDLTLRLTQAVRGSEAFRRLARGAAVPLRESLSTLESGLVGLAEQMADELAEAQGKGLPPRLDEWLEVRNLARRAGQFRLALDVVFSEEEEGSSVSWIEARQARRTRRATHQGAGLFAGTGERVGSREDLTLRLVSVPLEVSGELGRLLFQRLESVVVTSATLTVAGRFEFIRAELGIPRESSELCLGTPFDYRRCALLAVASDMPGPDEPGFYDEASRFLVKLVASTRGRALVLFTSYESLGQIRRRVEDGIASLGLRLLCQGDAPRWALLDGFTRDPASVLFGTESFWQGVDVPGESLSCLVIVRLPFAVPTDPLVEARSERLVREGRNPFVGLELPRAILKFKQGFGRLIRTADDRGAVIVLDTRLIRRRYGRLFIGSLPACTLVCAPGGSLADEVGAWLAGRGLTSLTPLDVELEPLAE